MKEKFILSPSPHVYLKSTTPKLMRDVIVGLIPAVICAIYLFRQRAVIVLLSCVIPCVIFEYAYQRLMKKKVTVNDYSAFLTGLLLALVLPPAVPFWAYGSPNP